MKLYTPNNEVTDYRSPKGCRDTFIVMVVLIVTLIITYFVL